MVKHAGLDFSFSGLKTYTLNTVHEHANDQGEVMIKPVPILLMPFNKPWLKPS